jgi:hypothetical protein
MKKQIDLKVLSSYLSYQVKAKFKYLNDGRCRTMAIGTVNEIADNGKITCYDTVNSCPDKFKLLLKPMSALDEKALADINCDLSDQITMELFRDKQISLWNAPYGVVQILLREHYDVFGLIELGLAEAIKD